MAKASKFVGRLRTSLLRIAWYGLGAFFVLLVSTVSALVVADRLRWRKNQKIGFPHPRLEPVTLGDNTLQLYCYGQDLYDAMLAAIDSARETIYIESFIWKGDEVGEEFKRRLVQKAEQGVDVYVIFDGFGNLVVPREFKHFPPEINLLEYGVWHVVRHPWQFFDPRRYALDHRKLLIVDGNTGFIGGYNIGSLYATQWRDTHLQITGPATADLADSFVDFWNRVHSHNPIQKHYQRKFDPRVNVHENDALRLTFPIRNMYIEALSIAERSVLLTNAYFVPDHVLLEALIDTAKRGVDVRILVPWHSNHVIVDWIARGYFTACLEAGIHILGYRYAMIHAKTCVIDDEWLTVGTANLDRLSSVGNFEINLEVYSPELARQMHELFECDTTEALELKLDDWKRRPWYAKISELIVASLRALV